MLRPLIYIGAGEHININTIMEFEVVNIFDRPMTLLTGVMLKANEKNGDNIKKTTIGDFVDPKRQYQYIEKIQRIRELCPNLDEKLLNKSVVDVMKKALPAGIISGVATDGIGEVNIVERNGVIAFDIDAACSGFVYGLKVVRQMLKADRPMHAILIGAETLSKLLDWHDRSTAVLFGDGAAGVLMTNQSSESGSFISEDLKTLGKLGKHLTAGQVGVKSPFAAPTNLGSPKSEPTTLPASASTPKKQFLEFAASNGIQEV